ncbi:hypothetical protein [Leuconostoc gasicomitatum]|uniref:hypothetical protein n=1 Tax=Leuconostoc gasicomitatum TaxID=115778 RepID=UPI001CC48010|nr:hypothetical protein [Leuconostoc gasicomitatum]MBZ5951386.1 hypothetical protein [Leuconostoc gasicomitatum]
MRIKDVIGENNELQKQLNMMNTAYYEQVVIYGRMQGALKSDQLVEAMLLDILRDILDAQRDGHDAQAIFGDAHDLVVNTLLEIPDMNLFILLKQYWLAVVAFMLLSLSEPIFNILRDQVFYGGKMVISVMISAIILAILYRYRESIATAVIHVDRRIVYFGLAGFIVHMFIMTWTTNLVQNLWVIHF